ncbi:unnamed protein product [Anisakis simplex]|uniref:NTR domain-containing protein n=1 Tax=Anisakis simplex TaxID=6269 RepID=A0A3P6QNK1_ANISI|nr:unnamed protein product [Anisakis simplex]
MRHGEQSLWIPNKNVICKCPKIRIGKRYLMLGRDDTNDISRPGIVLNSRSVLMEWDEELLDKVTRFTRKQKRGQCPARRRF